METAPDLEAVPLAGVVRAFCAGLALPVALVMACRVVFFWLAAASGTASAHMHTSNSKLSKGLLMYLDSAVAKS